MSPIHFCRLHPCPVCSGAGETTGGRFVHTATFASTPGYPCDHGIPGNVTSRGWHHFEASPNGVVVCRYCGRKP